MNKRVPFINIIKPFSKQQKDPKKNKRMRERDRETENHKTLITRMIENKEKDEGSQVKL